MSSLKQITAKDIAGWDTLENVASTFEKRGLKVRENLGEDNELVLQLTDREFIVLVEAGPGESASDFKPDDRRRRTNLVATNDYEEFTFLTRIRALDGQQHGRIKHQKLSFTKEQMTSESGEKNTILQKLNSLEYGSAAAVYDDLYDTKQVVKEFYQQFETLRTDLVQEVTGIPNDRGDAKQRYVQVTLDRMIFLYFIQEKRLLDRDSNYLHDHHKQRVDRDENVYDEFYEPLFFDFLAENKKSTEFGALPYLNGGLFSKNPIEEEFEEARLGDTIEQTNELFGDILDFLSDWNWNVDERLDIVDPKNLSPAILGHIFEQTVNQKEMGAYYTPEEITGYMSRRTIHPYLLDQLNEEVDANYEKIDDVFGFPGPDAESGVEALADGGAVTAQVPTENVETRHVEALYHDFLNEARVLDPAVGSGAFLLAAQEVLLDIYMQCIEFFQQLDNEGKTWELQERTVQELEQIQEGRGSASLYAKRSIILNNLYGVDIDGGAVEICKLRLWLSMVADIEDEPSEVEPLPNIDFNIRQGNSLVGFADLVEVSGEGSASLSNWGGGVGDNISDLYEDVTDAIRKHRNANSGQEAAKHRREAEQLIDTYSESLDKKILEQFHGSGMDEMKMSDLQKYHPFHWVLEFANIFKQGGFDILVGNPPYIRIQELSDSSPELKQYLSESSQFETPYYNYDISLPFVERSEQLLQEKGKLSFIMTNKWLETRYGKKLRQLLSNSKHVESIVDFTDQQVFEGLSTYVLILTLNQLENEYIKYCKVENFDESLPDTVANLYSDDYPGIEQYDTPYSALSDSPWTFIPKEEAKILEQFSSYDTLGKFASRIFQGIITGRDSIFILDLEKETESRYICHSNELERTVEIEKGIAKPLLKGDEFEKWYNTQHSKVVLFPYKLFDSNGTRKGELISEKSLKNQYPQAYAYLSENKDELESREGGKWKGTNKWFRFSRKQNVQQFDQKKIMTAVLRRQSTFAVDDGDDYVFVGGGTAGGYGIVLPDSSEISHEYLTAVLNSRVFEWNVQKTSTKFQSGYYSFGRKYIENLPIAVVSEPSVVESIAESIVDIYSSEKGDQFESEIEALEAAIDMIMYDEYFGLNTDIITIIKSNFNPDTSNQLDVKESVIDLFQSADFKDAFEEIYNNNSVSVLEKNNLRDNRYITSSE